MLKDNFGRDITYLRLAVTDRCNLRCTYCMPAEGILFAPRKEILSYEELSRLCSIYSDLGIRKIRITGGEPFLRRDLMTFLKEISERNYFDKISVTTNGTLTRPFLPELADLGIHDFNLSLDSINKERFERITRRNCFDEVMSCLSELTNQPFRIKINAVMMAGVNDDDFIPLTLLALDKKIDVRFIEEMPFNGTGKTAELIWTEVTMENKLRSYYPNMIQMPMEPGSTSRNFVIPGFKGTVGLIAAYTRSFCGTCNRIRLTPSGEMKTCLYAQKGMNLKEMLRSGHTDDEIKIAIQSSIQERYRNGWEAERDRGVEVSESMATIGG
ncbi:MAG: GTP 3',8-cyclase MoaA [Flavobacteriales bacterium]|nr:GTP 3',8-cyclase MoaA [Flavobacteriales bacterium]